MVHLYCTSTDAPGGPLSATAAGNMVVKTLAVDADEVDFNTPNVTFRVGYLADDTNGGTLIPGDIAVAHFCVQVD